MTIDWQNHIVDIIVDAEKDYLFKHLIAQNIANGAAKIDNPNTMLAHRLTSPYLTSTTLNQRL